MEQIVELKIEVDKIRLQIGAVSACSIKNDWHSTKISQLTFLIMCSGLYLWVFESVRQDLGLMLTVYSAMTIGLVILWFIICPLINRKSIRKLKETIDKLETVQNQL